MGGIAAGLDVVLRTDRGALVYDLELSSPAALAGVVVEMSGPARITGLDDAGALCIETDAGLLSHAAPRTFAIRAGGRRRALGSRLWCWTRRFSRSRSMARSRASGC